MSNSEQNPSDFNFLAQIVEASGKVKTVYAVAGIAIAFLFFFSYITLSQAQISSIDAPQLILLSCLFFITLIIILWLVRENYTAYGKPVEQDNKVAFPQSLSSTYSREISNLNGKSLILSLADVSDYLATAYRLPYTRIIDDLKYDSFTAIGIYGEDDILFEIICDEDKVQSNLKIIKDNLEVEQDSGTLKVFNVIEVAKLHSCSIAGRDQNNFVNSISLDNGKFPENIKNISYQVINVNKSTNPDLISVLNMPIIFAYAWIEPNYTYLRLNQSIMNNSQIRNSSLEIYRQLCQSDGEIYSLYLINSNIDNVPAILIKSVFLVDRYYAFMRFTKSIDNKIRNFGYQNILQIRTVMGAEVILWK